MTLGERHGRRLGLQIPLRRTRSLFRRRNESLVDDNGRLFKDIRIKHTYILDDPSVDPPRLAEYIPDKSPEGKPHDETVKECLDEKLASGELEELIHAKKLVIMQLF